MGSIGSWRPAKAGLALAVAGLVLTSCSGAATEVRPFEEVQASPFVFEADPGNPNRATFRVTTTEPMICAIIWGETEALGNFNNSLGMNGTGITQHDVFLPGAQPGVEYFFKVQGSTADGTLYTSELATFTIPPPDVSAVSTDGANGANLALGATVVEVSSEFSPNWSAGNAIDGDENTEWATAGDGDQAFIVIDLGAEKEIGGAEFITRSMADGTAVITQYTVTVDDGEPLGPFPAGNLADTRLSPITASGRIVRFEAISSTGGNTGTVEVRVFAPGG